jgi:YidC/Oxa1 family membrane protein insertase
MSRRRALSLLLLLILLTLLLSGCQPEMVDGQPVPPAWIRPIADPLAWLINFVDQKILAPLGIESIGWAIILVTILLKILLYPLTKKQMDSMRKMQQIQPQMKEIQEKYGKDREKLAQKQMELYKEAGVNPAMGCLPLLLQMPILFAFYYALLSLGSALEESWLWIPNLAFPAYSEGMSWLTPISIQHLLSPEVWPFLVLPIVYVVSQLVMQRMSQAANPSSMGGSTNTVMMLMPLMFGYITLIVPSGLTLYWVTSNILQIIQQGLATGWGSILPSPKPKAAMATAGVSATTNKSSSGGKTPGAVKSVAESAMEPSTESQPSAGRRRKMRKKKR